jgi:hypothetical protein
MKKIRTILTACDMSLYTPQVLDYALATAKAFGADIILANVINRRDMEAIEYAAHRIFLVEDNVSTADAANQFIRERKAKLKTLCDAKALSNVGDQNDRENRGALPGADRNRNRGKGRSGRHGHQRTHKPSGSTSRRDGRQSLSPLPGAGIERSSAQSRTDRFGACVNEMVDVVRNRRPAAAARDRVRRTPIFALKPLPIACRRAPKKRGA